MQYFISFLEGVITFISPCLLPMLPIYISYFAGGNVEERESNNNDNYKARVLKNALGFVFGFTLIFTLMGAFAGSIGVFFKEFHTMINIVSGLVVIIFGFNFLGILQFRFTRNHSNSSNTKPLGFFSSFLFGIVFSVGWTPCVGAFLGSALMLASQQGSTIIGIIMLLSYSLGLGIPFIFSAILIDRLKQTFDFIKRNYRIINLCSGLLLILIGLLMMTGTMGYLLSMLS